MADRIYAQATKPQSAPKINKKKIRKIFFINKDSGVNALTFYLLR